MFLSCVQEAEKLNLPINGINAAITDGEYYAYFRGNVTGWEPNASTMMTQASTNVWESTFAVTESWMVSNGQNLSFTLTNQLNGWGSGSVTVGDPIYTWPGADVPVNGTATTSSSSVLVKFPALGTYKALFNAVTYSYLITDDLNATLPDETASTTIDSNTTTTYTLTSTTTTVQEEIPYIFSNITGWTFDGQTQMSLVSGDEFEIFVDVTIYWQPELFRFYLNETTEFQDASQFSDLNHNTYETAGVFDANLPFEAEVTPFSSQTQGGTGETWFHFPQVGSYRIRFNRSTLAYTIEPNFDANTPKRVPFIRSNLTGWQFDSNTRMEAIAEGLYHKRITVSESWQQIQNFKFHRNYFNGDYSTNPIHYHSPAHNQQSTAGTLPFTQCMTFVTNETDTYINFGEQGDFDLFWCDDCDHVIIQKVEGEVKRPVVINFQFNKYNDTPYTDPIKLEVRENGNLILDTTISAEDQGALDDIIFNLEADTTSLDVKVTSCFFEQNYVLDVSDTSKCEFSFIEKIHRVSGFFVGRLEGYDVVIKLNSSLVNTIGIANGGSFQAKTIAYPGRVVTGTYQLNLVSEKIFFQATIIDPNQGLSEVQNIIDPNGYSFTDCTLFTSKVDGNVFTRNDSFDFDVNSPNTYTEVVVNAFYHDNSRDGEEVGIEIYDSDNYFIKAGITAIEGNIATFRFVLNDNLDLRDQIFINVSAIAYIADENEYNKLRADQISESGNVIRNISYFNGLVFNESTFNPWQPSSPSLVNKGQTTTINLYFPKRLNIQVNHENFTNNKPLITWESFPGAQKYYVLVLFPDQIQGDLDSQFGDADGSDVWDIAFQEYTTETSIVLRTNEFSFTPILATDGEGVASYVLQSNDMIRIEIYALDQGNNILNMSQRQGALFMDSLNVRR